MYFYPVNICTMDVRITPGFKNNVHINYIRSYLWDRNCSRRWYWQLFVERLKCLAKCWQIEIRLLSSNCDWSNFDWAFLESSRKGLLNQLHQRSFPKQQFTDPIFTHMLTVWWSYPSNTNLHLFKQDQWGCVKYHPT